MCIKTKYQAIISPSKIEGAGGSMMISSNFLSSFTVSLVFILPLRGGVKNGNCVKNSSPKLGEVPAGQRGMTRQKQLYINLIKKPKHLSYHPQSLLS